LACCRRGRIPQSKLSWRANLPSREVERYSRLGCLAGLFKETGVKVNMPFESLDDFKGRQEAISDRVLKEKKADWSSECLRLSSMIARDRPESDESTLSRAKKFLDWLEENS
jgi:hypothetical protein